jgi:hypothetical protein
VVRTLNPARLACQGTAQPLRTSADVDTAGHEKMILGCYVLSDDMDEKAGSHCEVAIVAKSDPN